MGTKSWKAGAEGVVAIIIMFLLARLARVAKVVKRWVPNPLLLATPVYSVLAFLSQRLGAPEQDR
jgi:energy-coupling factor transporter transmembrane protein EcfT